MSNFTMQVSRYMTAPVHTIPADHNLQTAYNRLYKLAVSSLAVVAANELVGVISRTDLLRAGRYHAEKGGDTASLQLPDQPVGELMTRDVATVKPGDSVAAACEQMIRRQIHRVFVVQGKSVVGVSSTRDVMQAIIDQRFDRPIEIHMSKPLLTVEADEPISLATGRLTNAHVTGLVVVEDDWPVGVFTQVDALQARALAQETPVDQIMNPAIVCLPPTTRMYRAAQRALAMKARRVIVCRQRDMVGIVSGLDFARSTL